MAKQKWKYRILEKKGYRYIIQGKPLGLIGLLIRWETLSENLNFEEARRICKNLINEEREKNNPTRIMEVFVP